ncbi:hypothetical protein DMUE_3851 [Dictyocoela muelleri]|nr:hypothetical protein DMUE_3851 [Dictyocoela muelleri]
MSRFFQESDSSMIIKSFKICGIIGEYLNVDNLHEPLIKLLSGEEINEIEIINSIKNDEQDELIINFKQWMFVGQDGNSLFKIISFILYDTFERHFKVRYDIVNAINEIEDLQDIHDEKYIKKMTKYGTHATELEIYAASVLYNITINLSHDPNLNQS